MRSATSPLIELDAALDAGLQWRRDDITEVRLTTNDSTASGTVKVFLRGIASDAGVSRAELPASTACAASLPCAGFAFCRCFTADLARPDFAALRGVMSFDTEWTAGSSGVVTQTSLAQVAVTRFKWRRSLLPAATQVRSPAVDGRGNVIVTVQDFMSGRVTSIDPSGRERFAIFTPAASAPLVHPVDDAGIQRVSVGRGYFTTNTLILAFDAADGGALPISCVDPAGGRPDATPLVLLDDPHQTVVTSTFQGVAIGERGTSCVTSSPESDVLKGALTTAAAGRTVYLTHPAEAIELDPFRHQLLSQAETAIMSGVDTVRAGDLGLVREAAVQTWYPAPWPPPAWTWPWPAGVHSPIWMVMGGAGEIFVRVERSTQTILLRVSVNQSSPLPAAEATMSTSLAPSGILAQDGLLYTVGGNGVVSVHTGQLDLRWSGNLISAAESFSINFPGAGTNIDCARLPSGAAAPGRPGTLYAVSEAPALYAIVIDARGIDTTAAWPKWMHDPANTGNSSTPLTPFSCP